MTSEPIQTIAMPQPGFWGAVDKFTTFMIDTEVPLAVVVVLLLLGAIREVIGAYAKWRAGP